jgi:Lhr-like helicase
LPVQELLFLQGMQTTHKSRSSIVRPTFKRTPETASWSSTRHAMSTYIADEIRAYATIRDLALAEAEKLTNSLNLERARIANEFVENSLKPARSPYESQHLPEGDAARERQRCEAVKVRLSLLHAHLDSLARDRAHAA